MKHYSQIKNQSANLQIALDKFKESILAATTEFDTDNPTDEQILRIAITSELSAINLYQQLRRVADNEDLKKVLDSITKEEKVHTGEFQTLLNRIDTENNEANEEGFNEVYNIIEESRIIYPNEKTIIDNKMVRPGDYVYHYKFGIGQIKAIDLKTYSMPFITFEPNNMNDEIYRDASEFKQLNGNQLRDLHNK